MYIRFAITLDRLLQLLRFCANLRKRKLFSCRGPGMERKPEPWSHAFVVTRSSFCKLVMLEMVVQLKEVLVVYGQVDYVTVERKYSSR
jgi:hypothetical protein